jgi:hypothetical protein
MPREWRMLAAFTLAAYVAWIVVFHYYRYAVPFEMLAGVFVCGAASLMSGRRTAVAIGVAAILAALLVGTTRRMGWERTAFGTDYFAVTVPPVDPGALVIVAGDVPMSYTLPFFPRNARFISPTNNFLRLGQSSAMAKRARGCDPRAPRAALHARACAGDERGARDPAVLRARPPRVRADPLQYRLRCPATLLPPPRRSAPMNFRQRHANPARRG